MLFFLVASLKVCCNCQYNGNGHVGCTERRCPRGTVVILYKGGGATAKLPPEACLAAQSLVRHGLVTLLAGVHVPDVKHPIKHFSCMLPHRQSC